MPNHSTSFSYKGMIKSHLSTYTFWPTTEAFSTWKKASDGPAVTVQCALFRTIQYCALIHLCSSHLPIWRFTVGEHLPECDTIAPNITSMRKCSIVDGLRSIPVQDRQRGGQRQGWNNHNWWLMCGHCYCSFHPLMCEFQLRKWEVHCTVCGIGSTFWTPLAWTIASCDSHSYIKPM